MSNNHPEDEKYEAQIKELKEEGFDTAGEWVEALTEVYPYSVRVLDRRTFDDEEVTYLEIVDSDTGAWVRLNGVLDQDETPEPATVLTYMMSVLNDHLEREDIYDLLDQQPGDTLAQRMRNAADKLDLLDRFSDFFGSRYETFEYGFEQED